MAVWAAERPLEKRVFYLDHACAGDPDLRSEVERMLAVDGEAGGFLDEPAVEVTARALAAESLPPGSRFGPYEIVSLLGVGGMGKGAGMGPIVTAVESRFKTCILQGGGLDVSESNRDLPGAVQEINFLPRVKIPVLMMNGKDDFFGPPEQSQIPMFRLLGTPEKDKRHAVFNSGHSVPKTEVIREVLAWLEHYLGPVKPKYP